MDLVKETKGLIHNVLTSSKQTLTIRKLNSEYYQLVGNNIPFSKLGFPSLELYLRSLPDILQVYGQGESAEVHVIVSKKSAHVRELISKQRDSKKSAGRGNRKSTNVYTQPQYFGYSTTSSNQRSNMMNQMFLANQINGFFQKGMKPPMVGRSNRFNQYIPSLFDLPIIPQGFNKNFGHSSSYVESQYRPSRPVATSSYNTPDKSVSGSNNYRFAVSNNHSLHESKNHSLHESKNHSLHESKNHSLHESKSSKFPSLSNVIEPLCSIVTSTPINNNCKPDDFKSQEQLQRKKETCANLKAKETGFSEDEVYFSDEEQLNTKVPQVIQENLRRLISKYPNGIWSSEIPEAYKKQFDVDLNYVDYGYTSLSQMCMDMGNSFKCVQPKQGDYKIFDKFYPVNLNPLNTAKRHKHLKPMNNSTDPAQLALPQDGVEDLLSNIHKVSIPSNIVRSGEFIERQWIDRSVRVLSYLDVNIGEIYDPSKFWLNLCEFGNQLNMLMDDMQKFYGTNSKKYEAPHFVLKTGLYVAAVFLKEYHRALIVDTMNDYSDKIKLFFIDYGTVAVVNISGVCYLCKQFAELPAQGIRARLAGICPLVQKEHWSRKAAEKFQSLVSDKDLVAQIINTDEEKEILDVILTDTRGEEDFFINDALVSEELAVFSQYQVTLNQSDDFVHLYPTFAELENGSPRTENQIDILNQAYTPNRQIYPQSFNHFSMNKMQNLCSRCMKKIQVENVLGSAGSAITEKKCVVKHIGVQTDNYNIEQIPNESVTVLPPLPIPPSVNYIIPTFQEIKHSENNLNLNNHALTLANGDMSAACNQNDHHNISVIPLSSNLNPSATPFHPTHTNTPIPYSQNEIIHNEHSSTLSNNADNFPIPSTSSNNAINFPIYDDPFLNESNSVLNEIHLNGFQNSVLNQDHNVKYENQDQPTCTIEFSALQSETIEIVPLLHQTAIQLQNDKETANVRIESESVIKKCYVKIKDSFKFVTKTTLQDGIIHVIVYNNDDHFLVDEIVYGLFGTTLSIVQIRKMFVGTQNMIPSFISINLNKFQSLKQELLACNLTQESTVWINVAPVSCLLYFVTFLTRMPKPFYICN